MAYKYIIGERGKQGPIMKKDEWTNLIESVANRSQYSFSWDIGLPDFPVRSFNWFENDLFLVAVRRCSSSVFPIGLDIRIFHKVSKKNLSIMVAGEKRINDFKTILSYLNDPKKLPLCIGFDWASEFIEESLKESALN